VKCSCGDKAEKWVDDLGVNVPKCVECFVEITTGIIQPPARKKWSAPVNSLKDLEGEDDEQED
jgi:hypothetical protein